MNYLQTKKEKEKKERNRIQKGKEKRRRSRYFPDLLTQTLYKIFLKMHFQS